MNSWIQFPDCTMALSQRRSSKYNSKKLWNLGRPYVIVKWSLMTTVIPTKSRVFRLMLFTNLLQAPRLSPSSSEPKPQSWTCFRTSEDSLEEPESCLNSLADSYLSKYLSTSSFENCILNATPISSADASATFQTRDTGLARNSKNSRLKAKAFSRNYAS